MTHISASQRAVSYQPVQRRTRHITQTRAKSIRTSPKRGLLDRLNPFSAKGSSDTSVGFLDKVKNKAGPIAGGVGGAVMGFFMGGPPGAIVGAAVGAGVGFLLPKIFDKVIGVIKNNMPRQFKESFEPPQANDPIRQDEEIFKDSQHSFSPSPETPNVYTDLKHNPSNINSMQEPVDTPLAQENANRSQAPTRVHKTPLNTEDDYAEISQKLKNIPNQGFDHYRSQRPLLKYRGRKYVNLNSLDGGKHIGGQTHYPPSKKGNGNGKTVYMFIGFKGTRHDQGMRKSVEPFFVDDVQRMRNHGYKVVVDTRGTQSAFQNAINDDSNAGIIWAGHGVKSGIQDSRKGHIFTPQHITPNQNSQMRFCIFETCLAGNSEKAWESRLNTDVKAHNRVIYTSEIREFADPDPYDQNELDDYITRHLVQKPW